MNNLPETTGHEKDPIERIQDLCNEALEIAKALSKQQFIYNGPVPAKVTPEEREGRKLIHEFEGHKYYEGDRGYYFNKKEFYTIDHSIHTGLRHDDFLENDQISKIYPIAALRDAALEEYKRSKEHPEFVECTKGSEPHYTTNKIYPCNGRADYLYHTKNNFGEDDAFHVNNFKPSTAEAYERQELLERAKREYPKGTRFRTFSDEIATSDGDLIYSGEEPDNIIDGAGYYVYKNHRWAKVLPSNPVIDLDYCIREYEEKYAHIVGGSAYDDVISIAHAGMKGETPQEAKLSAIARELIVSTVLNGEAKENPSDERYTISWHIKDDKPNITMNGTGSKHPTPHYKTRELAQQAIEILGEDTIKRARI